MSENLSSGSSGENLVSPPPRQNRPAPQSPPAPQRAKPTATKPQPEKKITGDDMKLKKSVTVNKPIKFKDAKKND